MKRRTPNILAILGLLCGLLAWGASPARADEHRRFELETRMMERINAARLDPLGTAAAMGFDPERILADLPELREILIEGLPPLYFSAELRQAARSHSADMLARDFFGKISPEGAGPEERIRAAGYLPVAAGETIGVLGFFNFIPPMDAVDRIFENLLRDELNPTRSEPRLILSPDMEEIGIGFDAGPLALNGTRLNVYLFTCDFGRNLVSPLEMSILGFINRVRADPARWLDGFEADEAGGADEVWVSAFPVPGPMPPLAFHPTLYLAAWNHAEDMLSGGYYAGISPDGRNAVDRVGENGYDPLAVREAMRLFSTVHPIEDPEAMARANVDRILRREATMAPEDRILLHPHLRDAGIRIATLPANYWRNMGRESLYDDFHTQLIVATLGVSERENPETGSFVAGRFFADWDGDGVAVLDEMVPGVPLNVYSEDRSFFLHSDRVGGFSLALPPGEYGISPWFEAVPPQASAVLDGIAARWFDFALFVSADD